MVKNLQNLYWENKLNEFLNLKASELGYTKSNFIRLILKKELKLCLYDGCFIELTINNYDGYCLRHKKRGMIIT